MAEQQNVIELNGRRYDARTGALLSTQASAKPAAPPKHPGKTHAGVIDGFMRPTHGKTAGTAHHHAITNPHAAKKAAPRRAGTHLVPHQPEHAKTLMRRAVHKPQTTLKPAIKTQPPVEMAAAPVSAIAPKLSATHINPVRLQRAGQVGQSAQVRHFAASSNVNGKAAASIPVTRASQNHAATANQAHRITGMAPPAAPAQQRAANRPAALAARRGGRDITFARQHAQRQPAAVAHPAHVAAVPATARGSAEPDDVFAAALAHASSHKQPKPRVARPHRRLINLAAGIAIFFILAGFAAYTHRTNIAISFASVRAGFQAQLPRYTPTGYALTGGVRTENGKVTLSFRSGASSYNLTQQASTWDSQTLADSTIGASGNSHRTIQSGGRTIYLYGNGGSNAAWVDGGVLYNLTGNASLAPDQIAAIAASM